MPFFFFQREYLAQALAANGGRLDSAGLLWIRATDPPALARIQGEVEDLFRNSAARAVAQTEQSFLGGAFTFLQDFLRLILGVTALITLCVLFIAGNTASLAIQERAKETGVLRALGFPRGTILTMLLAETGLLVWVAGALGVGAALGLTYWLRSSRFAEAFPPIGSFHVDFPIIVSSLALSVFIGVVAGLAPSLNAARRQPSELLRRSD
jgi:putative ABC transport system permease protein